MLAEDNPAVNNEEEALAAVAATVGVASTEEAKRLAVATATVASGTPIAAGASKLARHTGHLNGAWPSCYTKT